MKNVDIIKHSLLPLLKVDENNAYKNIFYTAWKTDFVKTIKTIDEKNEIGRDKLDDLTLEKALDKYSSIINKWTPDKTLEVFWIKSIKVYSINQYPVLKSFYEFYQDTLFQALSSLKSKNKDTNNEVLLKLALNHDLSEYHYKIFEKKNLSLVKDKAANIDYFKGLVKIGNKYKSSLLWEYYLEFHKSNQIFLNKVKEYFLNEKIEYHFDDKELEILSKNKFTRTLQINPEFLCKYNTKITAKLLDDIVTGLNNFYHILAKEIEENAEMEVNYKKAGQRVIMLHFENLSSLQKFEEKINDFQSKLKDIISKVHIEKSKAISEYTTEIEKTYLYYHLNEKFDQKQKEKPKKI